MSACMIQSKILNSFARHKPEANTGPRSKQRASACLGSNPMSLQSYLVNKLDRHGVMGCNEHTQMPLESWAYGCFLPDILFSLASDFS